MKSNVVYFLGAGFSHPLGLPVMNDFYMKGRDLYFKHPDKFKYFLEVIENVEKLSMVKVYYNSDLFNIEEILSIIEMSIYLDSDSLKLKRENFINFIVDVVKHTTPKIEQLDNSGGREIYDYLKKIVGKAETTRKYCTFVAGLFPITFHFSEVENLPKRFENPTFRISKEAKTNYSVITLNYDMVIENFISFLNNSYPESETLVFSKSFSDSTTEIDNSIFLVKLHGSIDDKSIIPPTWSKNLEKRKILEAWKTAYRLLSEAEHIRIIGYSLPETDINIRYLLKSSILKSRNLQNIDVLCFDPEGKVKAKYDDFIEFKRYQFYNAKVEEYLKPINYETDKYRLHPLNSQNTINFDVLEKIHSKFKKDYKKPNGNSVYE